MLKKIISFVLSFTLITIQPIFAQGADQINLGNYLRTVGSSMAMDKFRPLHMRYFSYDALSDNFQLLLDKGDNKDIKEAELEEKTKVLMEYFQIGLALPNEKFWVNLRPDAQDQIIDPELEKTDMGRIMLEADLQLKKDTAGLTSPQNPEGKAYWDKLYKKAGELFGSENITIPTITRPWIVPGEIILRQGEDSAYIFKANMKVMLEQDHLVSRGGSRTAPTYQQYAFTDPRMKELNEYSSQLIRELIIPRLTKEVNTSKRYAALRQVFFSLVMARWFKDTFQGKSGQYAQLIDSHNLNNLISKEAWSKTYYFNEYKKSFEKGEYNLKEEVATPTGQVIRSYVSGGENFDNIAKATSSYVSSPIKDGRYNDIEDAVISWALAGAGLAMASLVGTLITVLIIGLTPGTLRPVPLQLNTAIQRELEQVNVNYYRILEFLKDEIGEPIAISGGNARGKVFFLGNKNKRITVTEKFRFPNDILVYKCYYKTAGVVVPGYLIILYDKITVTFFKDEDGGIQDSSGKINTEFERKKIIKILKQMFTEKNREALRRRAPRNPKGSSPLIKKSVESPSAIKTGGIDFRAMNYLVQPMGSFKDLQFGLPTLSSSALERIDLDKELESLRSMVKAGMVPSGMRVKEYLAACFQKGKIEEKQDDLLVCLAEIYRLAEEENLETSPELRESLVIVDTGKFVLLPNNQKVGLN